MAFCLSVGLNPSRTLKNNWESWKKCQPLSRIIRKYTPTQSWIGKPGRGRCVWKSLAVLVCVRKIRQQRAIGVCPLLNGTLWRKTDNQIAVQIRVIMTSWIGVCIPGTATGLIAVPVPFCLINLWKPDSLSPLMCFKTLNTPHNTSEMKSCQSWRTFAKYSNHCFLSKPTHGTGWSKKRKIWKWGKGAGDRCVCVYVCLCVCVWRGRSEGIFSSFLCHVKEIYLNRKAEFSWSECERQPTETHTQAHQSFSDEKKKKTQLMFCHWWRQTGQIIYTNFSFKFSVWNFSEIPSMLFLLTLFNVCNVICNEILLPPPRWPCSRLLWGEHNGDQRAPPFSTTGL